MSILRTCLRVGLVCGALALAAAPAHAQTTAPTTAHRVGDLRIVDALDASHALSSGGSATGFQLQLPDGATCPGDSEHDEWRTQAFLFAPSVDPATIQYSAAGAVGDGVFKLYDTKTVPYRHELLFPNDGSGQPGQIPAPPAMDFAVYTPGKIPPGPYTAAIACTLNGQLDRWWGLDLDIEKSSDDSPGQLRWKAAGASTTGSSSGSSDHTLLYLALIVIVVVGLVLVIRTVTGSRRAVPSKEK